MNKSNIIPEITYQEKPILDKFSCYLNGDLSNIASEILRPYGDKIIDIIRHGEPEKLENGKKLGLTEKGKKQIELQAERLKEFYKKEKITIFCDLETQRMQETFNILSDEKYGLNIEVIQDDRLSTSYGDGTNGEKDAKKNGEIGDFWKEQIKNKKHKNMVILGHSSFITFFKSITEDGYDTLNLDFEELGFGGDMHIRLSSENNKKDVLNGKLNITFSNFEEIKQDLLLFENKELEKILNSKFDKNNIGNLLNNFFDRNIDLIIENFINFGEFKNNDLKDFFINKTYNFGEELNKEDYFEGLNIKEDVLMYVEDEIKNRDFDNLGNLLKVVDTFDIEEKIRIISFIEINKFDFNCSLLQDPLNNITHYNPQSLYEKWKQKRGLGDRERITIESNIENNIKNKAKEIKLNIDSLPILNKENWDNNFVDIFNGILEQVKKFKIYYSEFTEEQKNLFEVGILGEIEINSLILESKNRSINSQDIFFGKNSLRIIVIDYLNDNLHIFREFGENLNSDLFYFCLDNNLKIDNSIPTDSKKNKGFLLELENIIKSNKELNSNKINISDIDEYSLSKETLKQFSLYKVQKLDFNKLFLLTQKGYLDLFEKDIFEHIKNDLSGKEKKKMEKIVEGVGNIVDDTGLYNFKGKTGVRGYIGEFLSDVFRAFKLLKKDVF